MLLDVKKLMTRMQSEIAYLSSDIAEMIRGNRDSFICCEAAADNNICNDPCKALESSGYNALSNAGDRALFSGFVHGLGISDTQGQLDHIKLHLGLLEQRLVQAKEACQQKAKLYVVLGLFSGVLVSLIFL